jgi:hypothetical protein
MNPYETPKANVEDGPRVVSGALRVLTYHDYLKAWASSCASALLAAVVGGGIMGLILGSLLQALGLPISQMRTFAVAFGFILGVGLSYLFFRVFVLRFIVRKVRSPNMTLDNGNDTQARLPLFWSWLLFAFASLVANVCVGFALGTGLRAVFPPPSLHPAVVVAITGVVSLAVSYVIFRAVVSALIVSRLRPASTINTAVLPV